jgi:hypothetical protein
MSMSAPPHSRADTLRITLAIATLGRRTDLGQALNDLTRQTRRPDRVIVSATGQGDIDDTAVRQCCVPVMLLCLSMGTYGVFGRAKFTIDFANDVAF